MLNLKKGLALVLAAATAFTFAPIGNLSAPVSAQAETNPVIKVADPAATGDDADKDITSYDIAQGNAKVFNYSVTGASATDKFYFSSSNAAVAEVGVTKADNSAVTNGSENAQGLTGNATVTGSAVGSANLTLQAGAKYQKNVAIRVLGTKRVTGADFGTVAKNVAKGTKQLLTTVTVNGSELSATLSTNDPANDVIVSGFNVSEIEKKTTSVSADRTSATVEIYVTSTKAEGADTNVIITVGRDHSDLAKVKTQSKATANTATGGVLNTILAYKGASYNLAEHASIKYQPQGESTATNFSTGELDWYLVDQSKKPVVGEQRADLKSLNIPTTDGTIESGRSGSLNVTVADADKFYTDVNGKAVVAAEALIKGVRTVVYVGPVFNVQKIAGNVALISKTISQTVTATGVKKTDKKIGVLDAQIANPTQDNKYITADDVTFTEGSEVETNANYDLTVKKASGTANPFKDSYITLNDDVTSGDYYETAYIPFKVNGDSTNTTYIQKVSLTIAVNTGVKFRVKDGSSVLATTYDEDLADDPTVYLNLADAKTWNIKDHIETDAVDSSKVSFTFSSDSANVDVDANGVLTAKSVGNAVITIKASYNGIGSKEAKLQVRVNQYGFDKVTVKGQDNDEARVLNVREFNNNEKGADSEEQLVTRQIPYVQIEITGYEKHDVVETPVVSSANKAKLSYSFVKDYSGKGLTIDPSTGKITINYNDCIDDKNPDGTYKFPTARGVYAVKVVSAETAKSSDTTNYFYVVVDYPDQKISGLQDSYTVGACPIRSTSHKDVVAVNLYTESGETAKLFKPVNKKTDDFEGTPYYSNDDTDEFDQNLGTNVGTITKAYSDKQTEHVLAYNQENAGKHVGYTAKLITVKSAPAVENKVTKITNKDTGDVIYDAAKDSAETAKQIHISDITDLQVTLEHPVAPAVSGSAVTLAISKVDSDGKDVINQLPYVTAVKNKNNVDVVLYPNTKGTTVIRISPDDHLTATDRTDIHHTSVLLAVEYDGKNASNKPAQVKGVKVKNKKGGFVTVTWTKQKQKNIKYYVKKTVGKKSAGKSVNGGKTTLTVKKGAKVKVKVKAYVYDSTGKKLVGKYSKTVTFKTDKK